MVMPVHWTIGSLFSWNFVYFIEVVYLYPIYHSLWCSSLLWLRNVYFQLGQISNIWYLSMPLVHCRWVSVSCTTMLKYVFVVMCYDICIPHVWVLILQKCECVMVTVHILYNVFTFLLSFYHIVICLPYKLYCGYFLLDMFSRNYLSFFSLHSFWRMPIL